MIEAGGEKVIAKVIVDVPLMQTDKPYSYQIPSEFEDMVEAGMRVHVPFGKGNRLIQGIVVDVVEEADTSEELKAIGEVLDYTPVLNQEQFWLADQLRKSVFSYKITILKAMLPSLLNSSYDKILYPQPSLDPTLKKKLFGEKNEVSFSSLDAADQAQVMRLVGFSREVVAYFIDQDVLEITEREVNRAASYYEGKKQTRALVLNPEQSKAVKTVVSKLGKESKPFLLEGVTGSGKTEVYLQIIQEVLNKGKTAIMLVPEISLTPQMTDRFISRFGQEVAILHSGLSNGEKYDQWRKVERGEAKVVVGARSAIFAPLKNIGAIIIDEEHEASYKQDSNPRYHAREVAVLRAQYNQAVLLLGSATPSLESRARATKGVYELIRLTQRANPAAKIPEVKVVDFRDYIGQNEAGNFTPVLVEAISDRLQKKEQVVLMLNRRGYSSFVMCRECGTVDTCPNCDISLTLHMDTKTMNCHYCGYSKAIPRHCPNCQSSSIRYYGTGTQKAYDELQEIFPEAKILRMDVDTTRKKGSHAAILDAFGNGEADILLGTQMIAKGLDFPNVTLVGVLNADTSLNLPDYRSSERTFQLLTQVAGRAGRAEKEGEVIIQSYNPNHYAIRFAKDQDYEGFFAYEMQIRRQLGYTPYYFTVGLNLSHKSEEIVMEKSHQVMEILHSGLSDQVQILGPTPKPIARTHNLYHYQIIVKYRFEEGITQVLNQILEFTQEKGNQDLRVSIDNEPQSFM